MKTNLLKVFYLSLVLYSIINYSEQQLQTTKSTTKKATTTRTTTKTTPRRITTTTTKTTPRRITTTTTKITTTKKLSCGVPAIKPELNEQRIINGYLAVPHSWPWMVSIGYIGKLDSALHVCGGTLINSKFILTAAHCVEENSIYSVLGTPSSGGLAGMARIYVGISDVKTDKKASNTYRVKKITKHPYYDENSDNLINDLALMELTTTVVISKNVTPICINKNIELTIGQKVFATGWGQTDPYYAVKPTYLMQVQFVALNPIQCSKWKINTAKQICAGTYGTNSSKPKDTCSGDSGGPIMTVDSSGLWNIVGIVSFGSFPCDGLGVYTKVKAFYNWITYYSSF